jgi:hypothetical protein
LGVISHGELDYIPHCYPIKSITDIVLGIIIIFTLTLLTNKKYRFITGLAFFGCIFPDLVDELVRIGNIFMGISLPIRENYFPWQWDDYSGSIYTHNCGISNINHILLILTVAIFCWFRRTDLRRMFETGY